MKIVRLLAESPAFQETEETRSVLADKLLEARIRAALSDRNSLGTPAIDVTAVKGKVTLTGTWASAADIGEKASGTAENEKNEKHLKVSSIKHIADSCSAPTAKKGKKSKAAAAPTT